MDQNYLLSLTSISQWTLFAGIVAILFGWVEKRYKIVLAGQVVFLISGLMAIWVVLTNQIIVPETIGVEIPKSVKALAYFKGIVLLSAITGISISLKLFNVRFHKAMLIIVVLVALFLFFLVFSLQKMA